MRIIKGVFVFFRAVLISRSALVVENLALRQQLSVLRQSVKRPRLRMQDRVFWVWLARIWRGWRNCLVVVKPETVVKWHRKGFRLYWRWKSRKRKPGRPKVEYEVRELIQRMSRENPTWGAPRIQSELHLLGFTVAESTVSKYLIRRSKPPSQTWRTFLENHVDCLASIDFFTVPTATYRIVYCFLVLCHDRRRVVHYNVTAHPSQQWTAQQIVEAFPYDEAPSISDSRPGLDLRRMVPPACEEHGHRRSDHCASIAMAESILRKAGRLRATGVSGPYDRPERRSSATDTEIVLRLLSRLANASFTRSKRTQSPRSRARVAGQGHRHSPGWRIASSVHTCCLNEAPCLVRTAPGSTSS